MSSIFTKIVKGEIPSYKIYEDEKTFSFLDINPVAKGHTLIIPKREINLLWDVPDEEYADLMSNAKMIAKAIEKSVDCLRVGMAVVGLEVPHAHIHLIPLKKMSDFSFANKLDLPETEMKEIQEKIKSNL